MNAANGRFYWEVVRICPANTTTKYRRVTRGGGRGGEDYPALFQNLGRSTVILGKNALIVVTYGLNFSFKMQFWRVSRRINGACGAFVSRVVHECLSVCSNSKKTPLL